MYRFNRRRAGALALIAAGLVSLSIPLLFHGTTSPVAPGPGGGGGNGGNGGGTSGPKDTEAPRTSIGIIGYGYGFTRSGNYYYTDNFTVSLNATDDQRVASITLLDNGSSLALPALQFSTSGQSAEASIAITKPGLHMLQYYSTDEAGNIESTHSSNQGIGRPNLSDLTGLVANSGVDNPGIQNALLAKITAAQGELSRGGTLNSLNALTNQLNALDDKHGLTSSTVANIETMIQAILAT